MEDCVAAMSALMKALLAFDGKVYDWEVQNLVHASCETECDMSFDVTGLLSQQIFCRSWEQGNSSELFPAKLWRQNWYRIRMKASHVQLTGNQFQAFLK